MLSLTFLRPISLWVCQCQDQCHSGFPFIWKWHCEAYGLSRDWAFFNDDWLSSFTHFKKLKLVHSNVHIKKFKFPRICIFESLWLFTISYKQDEIAFAWKGNTRQFECLEYYSLSMSVLGNRGSRCWSFSHWQGSNALWRCPWDTKHPHSWFTMGSCLPILWMYVTSRVQFLSSCFVIQTFPYFGFYEFLASKIDRNAVHKFLWSRYKKYGPIWKEVYPFRFTSVNLVRPEDIETMFRMEGKTPERPSLESMKEVRLKYLDEQLQNPGVLLA